MSPNADKPTLRLNGLSDQRPKTAAELKALREELEADYAAATARDRSPDPLLEARERAAQRELSRGRGREPEI